VLVYLGHGAGGLLGVVFTVAAIGKLRSRRAFADFVASLQQMRLVEQRWSRPVAYAIAAAEGAVVVLLVAGLTAVAPALLAVGFGGATALFAALTTGVGLAVRRGVTAPCRCFGVTTTPLGPFHVARNAVLTLVAAIGLAAVVAARDAAPGAAELAVTVFAGAVLGAIVIALDDLRQLFAPPTRQP
jgi:hypothetical protein